MRFFSGVWIGFVLGLGFAFMVATKASGHETKTGWMYDAACCGGSDCQPVKDGVVVPKADGIWVDGFGILSYTDMRVHWSRDDDDHVCARGMKLYCVYLKRREM